MDCKTQKGLYFLIIGTIITAIYALIISLAFIFIQNFETMSIVGIFGIVSFVGAILVIIGAILFLMGRGEFGEKHQKNVKNAVIIFIINIVAVIVLSIVMSFIVYTSVSSSIPSSSEINSTPFSIIIVIISIVSSILGALIYYFALIELENEKGKKVLFAGIISSICISIFTSIYLAGMLGEIFGSISSINNTTSITFMQNTGGIGILGIIPSILFIYAFYIPYKRIKDGELVPQLETQAYSAYSGRICPNCGRPIPMDANICPYCGKNFE